jgi:hypothetical protein
MQMPRTVQEILDHAEELAHRFEDYDPDATDAPENIGLNAVRDAVIARSQAELALAKAVRAAHRAGHSWQSIGAMLGTSGEAARQRYGTFEPKPRRSRAAKKAPRKVNA